MTATAKIYHTDLLECERHNGVVTRLVTLARVIDLTSTDPQILTEALTAVGLSAGATLTGFSSNLILVDQSVRLVQQNKVVDVTNTYETKTQLVTSPAMGLVIASISSTLNQAQTNKDYNGDVVSLEHTFAVASSDTDPDAELSGQTFTVAANMSRLVPQSTVRFKGPMTITNPWLLRSRILGKVNESPWLGGLERTWLCTDFEAEAQVDTSNAITYEVTVEFQNAGLRNWDQDVILNHPRTGEPLADAVEGVGRKTVQIYETTNFERELGVRLLGG